MTQHINKTIQAIKARLDEVLTEYLGIDAQIEAGIHNDSNFFGSFKYYELHMKKTDLGLEHRKLTDALVTLEKYMK